VRWNAAKAFLRPIQERPNLQVWTGAQIARVRLGGSAAEGTLRATGVDVIPHGSQAPIQVDAMAEVILCGGAVGTPQILQLSGLGPAALMAQHGIPLQHTMPGVGGNLQDHLQVRTVFEVDGVTTLNTLSRSWRGMARMGLEYLFKRSGPLSMAPSQLGAFTRSSAAHVHPNLEYHVQPLSLDAFGDPLHRFNAFTASVCNLNPTSRGEVLLRSGDPTDAPLIHTRYLSTPEDRQVAVDALRVTRRIVGQPALAAYHPKERLPGARCESDEDLVRLAGDIGTTIFHPVGTCKMGPASDPQAVVDHQLRVHGVANLRVADASIMPTITSGNTSAPTLMIAERAAQWVIDDAARR